MEESPIDRAYTAAKNADAAAISGDHAKAAKLYSDAAQCFEAVADATPNSPAFKVLKALAAQHRDRSAYLSSGRAGADVAKAMATASTPFASALSQQLQAARSHGSQGGSANSNANAANQGGGITSPIYSYNSPTSSVNHGDGTGVAPVNIRASLAESLGSVISRSNQAFLKSFEGTVSASRADLSESFYLVGAHGPEDKGDIPGLAHAVEAATRAQRQAVKQGIHQILQDVSRWEQKLLETHQEEMDRMRAENDRLRVQNSKLKSRWDGLKESARKRRDEPA